MPVATRLLDQKGAATVSDLKEAGVNEVCNFIAADQTGAWRRPLHTIHSAFGQVFRRIGAVNVGSRPAPATNRSAKGVRQVVWAWPSPYRDEV